MNWPMSQDFNEAIQNPELAFSDLDLMTGETVVGARGLPLPRSGNFADVYQVRGAYGRDWAVKCFTRPVVGLAERYASVGEALAKASLPFTVDFTFLGEGIRVGGVWRPVVKMEWVEGLLLNQVVREKMNQPTILAKFGQMWVRMCKRLRESRIAHTDIQHGNVILVPGSRPGAYGLKLIDYDGMYVPALANSPSGESGHPAYQHPARVSGRIYSADLDRFPNLVIATTFKGLEVMGPALWEKYDTGDNLLFVEDDFKSPKTSKVMRELWQTEHVAVQAFVGRLAIACGKPIPQTPWLDQFAPNGEPAPLDDESRREAAEALGFAVPVVVATLLEPVKPAASSPEPGHNFDFTSDPQPEPAGNESKKPAQVKASAKTPAKTKKPRRTTEVEEPKSSNRLILLAGGLVVLLVGAGVGAVAFSGGKKPLGDSAQVEEPKNLEPKESGSKSNKTGGTKGKETDSGKGTEGTTTPPKIGPITIEPTPDANPSANRDFRIGISLTNKTDREVSINLLNGLPQPFSGKIPPAKTVSYETTVIAGFQPGVEVIQAGGEKMSFPVADRGKYYLVEQDGKLICTSTSPKLPAPIANTHFTFKERKGVTFSGQTVGYVHFRDDGRHLIAMSVGDGGLFTCDTMSDKAVGIQKFQPNPLLPEIHMLPKDEVAVWNPRDASVTIVDNASRKMSILATLEVPPGATTKYADFNVSADHRYVAAGFRRSQFRLLDTKTGKTPLKFDWVLGSIHFTADSSRVLIVEESGTGRWFKLPSGEPDGEWKYEPQENRGKNTLRVEQSSLVHGLLICISNPSGGPGLPIILDANTGRTKVALGRKQVVRARLSSDGKFAVVLEGAPRDKPGALVFYDVATGVELGREATPPNTSNNELDLSPQDNSVVIVAKGETGSRMIPYDLLRAAEQVAVNPMPKPKDDNPSPPPATSVPGDEKIAEELEKARNKFEMEMKKLRADVHDDFEKRLQDLRDKPKQDAAAIDKLKDEEKVFEVYGILGSAVNLSLRKRADEQRKSIEAAFLKAQRAYVGAKKDEQARAVDIEWKKLQTDGLIPTTVADRQDLWIPLFNGKDLTGWDVHGGKPSLWKVVDGSIHGECLSSGTWLRTRAQNYDDFHFRMEVMCLTKTRCTMQFRLLESPKAANYSVSLYGSQVLGRSHVTGSLEKFWWTGGKGEGRILQEAKGVSPPEKEWFTLEIVARGNSLTTIVNGEKKVEVIDEDNVFVRGTFNLSVFDTGGVVRARKIEVLPLPPLSGK